MLEEITLPEDYNGTMEQENSIVGKINKNFIDIEKTISEISNERMYFEKHIIDFEEYEIDLYFSDNKKKITLKIDVEDIVISISGNEIRIDRDGNVV